MTRPACARAGCARRGDWCPRFTFHMVAPIQGPGGKPFLHGWSIPAILSFAVCHRHRWDIREPGDVLGDGGAKLRASLEGMREGAKCERIAVDFVDYDHPDARQLRRMATKEPSS